MRQRLTILISLLAAVAFNAAHAQSDTTPATIVRVVDGDTVDVQLDDGSTDRLRLIGIDTPEVVDPRKPVQCFGWEASAHAHELLDGQRVSIEKDATQGDRDVYGRLLAYIWFPDGRNFGEVMIADGFAHEYTYDLPYTYQNTFKAAQDAAIANQLGLWSPATCAGDTQKPADNGTATSQPADASNTSNNQLTPDPSPHAAPAAGFDPTKFIGQGDRYNCSAFEPGRRPGSSPSRSTRPEQARCGSRRHRMRIRSRAPRPRACRSVVTSGLVTHP